MNVEEITSSLKKNDCGNIHSNLTVEYLVSYDKKDTNESGVNPNKFFNSKMAEASQLLVFEEIYKDNNCTIFVDIEDKVYKRYENILNKHNNDFIFSLKMPFFEWIKLQVELGHLLANIVNNKSTLSISKPVEEMLKTRLDDLYAMTEENQPPKSSATAV